MRSSRMRTAHSLTVSRGIWHSRPPPRTLRYTHPPAMHAPYHTCPLPRMPPAMHTPATHAPPHHACPPAMHAPRHAHPPPPRMPPVTHTPCHIHPLPCIPQPRTSPSPVDRITDACENITLPQLRCGPQ